MKCQEVMIYMQRQLDGDLAPNEEDELHAHLMHCLDCAQMFERLQALSDELSQLPKVTPPFSLVDAIMPQLLELDRQEATPRLDNVAAFSSRVARTETDEEPKYSGWSRFKEQFSWKVASGVVAAGLIIGFFAFNLGHPVLDNADGLFRTSSDSKSAPEKSAATASASDLSQIQEHDTLTKKKDATTSNQALPNDPTADSVAKATAKPADSLAGGGTAPQTKNNANLEKPGAYTSPAGGTGTLDRQASPSTTAPEKLKDEEPADAAKIDPKAETITPAAGLTAPNSSQESKADAPEKKTAPVPTAAPSSVDRTTASPGILSLSSPHADALLKSATGVYEATVEEAHVVIRNSSTHEIVFASKRVWQADDQIKLLEWSKDDKLFYEVTSKGTLQTILIDVVEKTEANK